MCRLLALLNARLLLIATFLLLVPGSRLLAAPDLSVTKSCASNGAQSILCTVTVTNIGDVASVAPMSITDTLTGSGTANLIGAGGSLPASCSPGAQVINNIPLTCPSINTSLTAGDSATLLISYSMPQGGNFTNCVSVSQAQNVATPGDPNPANNTNICTSFSVAAPVVAAPDLSVTKSCASNGAQSILCTVTVTNIGDVASVAPMSITDTLTGSGTANLIGAGGSLPASCSPGAQVINNIPLTCPSINTSLTAGDSATLLISYSMPQGGNFTNCVSVSQAQNVATPGDPNPANNTNICTTFTVSAPPPAIGSITIVKHAQPNDAQDFTFTSNVAAIAPFLLDDDSDPTLSNTRTFASLPAGTYSFTESAVSGWTLSNLVCTGGTATTSTSSRTASITLAAGDNVTCTFVNVKTTGSITIVKHAQPNDAQDFTFTSNVAAIAPFLLDDDSDPALSNTRTFTSLPAGTYSFTESAVSGWTLSSLVCSGGTTTTSISSGKATITLAAGDNVTCVYTNTKASTGTLTIVKDAQPDNTQAFHFTTAGAGLTPFTLDDDGILGNPWSNSITFTNLTPGIPLTVTEDDVSGWSVPSLQCLVAVPGQTTTFTDQLHRTFTVNLEAGANVTCTFINVKTTGSITIVKDAQPDDAQDFTFTSNVAAIAPFLLDDDNDPTLPNTRTFASLPTGTYTFTETPVNGWTLSNLACTGGTTTTSTSSGKATITLEGGNNVTCTFTNTQNTVATGKICGVKFNDLNGNGVQDAGDLGLANWQISLGLATIPPVVTGPKGDYCFTDLAAGSYTVSEIPQAPWQQTWPAGSGTYSLNLQAAQVITGINFGNKLPTGMCTALTNNPYNLLTNGDFESAPNVSANTYQFFDQSLITGWKTSAADGLIEVWGSNFNGVPAYSGNQFIELNATVGATLYQTFTATPGSTVKITFAHRGRPGFANQMSVAIGELGNLPTTLGVYTATVGVWTLNSVTWNVPLNGGTAYQISFISGDSSAGGNLLDAIQVIDQACGTAVIDQGTTLTDRNVFEFIESSYPLLFNGSSIAGMSGQYNYRFYTSTGNYLAVDDMGDIYVLEPATDNEIKHLGSITEFRQAILDWNAGPIPTARVFAYAEANYPALFKGQATDGQQEQYTYRYYPETRNTLAVDNAGNIYLLGPASGNMLTSLGSVESFRQQISNWYAELQQ